MRLRLLVMESELHPCVRLAYLSFRQGLTITAPVPLDRSLPLEDKTSSREGKRRTWI